MKFKQRKIFTFQGRFQFGSFRVMGVRKNSKFQLDISKIKTSKIIKHRQGATIPAYMLSPRTRSISKIMAARQKKTVMRGVKITILIVC